MPDSALATLALGAMAGVGVIGAAFYAFSSTSDSPRAWAILGAALLIAGASSLVGGFFGFLFAIPRSRQGLAQAPMLQPAEEGQRTQRLSDYAANTNLEQISDWLTKILVGAGLVELSKLPSLLGGAARTLAPALTGGTTIEAAVPVATCLIVYYVPWGFFFAYLLTRLWLPKALNRAERLEESERRDADLEAELVATERYAHKSLFDAPPLGFRNAIEAIDKYQNRTGSIKSPFLSLYMACAQGQRHAYEKAQGATAKVKEARDAAVAAIKEAISHGPAMRDTVADLYCGRSGNDDDLVSLKPDHELDELLKAVVGAGRQEDDA